MSKSNEKLTVELAPSYWTRLSNVDSTRAIIESPSDYPETDDCNWCILNAVDVDEGDYMSAVDNIHRLCSYNFSDIWNKYGFNPNILHGHSSEVVFKYLSKITGRMVSKGVKLLTDDEVKTGISQNPNMMWGVDNKGKQLDNHIRAQIVLYQLRYFMDMADLYSCDSCYWVGSKTNYIGDYKGFDGYDIDYKERIMPEL